MPAGEAGPPEVPDGSSPREKYLPIPTGAWVAPDGLAYRAELAAEEDADPRRRGPSPTEAPLGRRARWRTRSPTVAGSVKLSMALMVATFGFLYLLIPAVFPSLGTQGSEVNAGRSPGPACVAGAAVPAAALDILTPGPVGSISPGSTLSVEYQLRAVSLPTGLDPVLVEVPGVTASFPQPSGATIRLFLPSQTLAVTTGSWASAPTHSRTVTTSTSFTSGANADLSTQLIAVMASAPAGSFQLEVRWSWSIASTTGSSVAGPWSVPTVSGPFPSILTPEAYVALVSRSATSEAAGGTFEVELSGAAAHASLLLKLENASTGATMNQAAFTAPGTPGASFNGSIALSNGAGTLPAGNYLVHIHDGCGGILYNLPIQVRATTTASSVAMAALLRSD